jgi:hypothetical protein
LLAEGHLTPRLFGRSCGGLRRCGCQRGSSAFAAASRGGEWRRLDRCPRKSAAGAAVPSVDGHGRAKRAFEIGGEGPGR